MARVMDSNFSGSEISTFGARVLIEIALSADLQGFSLKFRPLKINFQTSAPTNVESKNQ